MKILDLHLRAFGPFTDCDLDLSGGQQGLHLIFGPNEAGKSSALRALRALLYGIPERTGDDFLHDRQDLRVGGRLRGSNGAEVHCIRRKGRKNTLLDSDGKTLPDDTLAPLLAGVDDRLFERLFGIDHEGLVSGGQALLAERGREAEALFGSGLGGVNLNAVLRRLDEEASA
ncbi:MAG: AAA family ATPase, partial [Lamprocystis purpurea]|nr:AAA family ATPase [Lamprocystis purpurea]